MYLWQYSGSHSSTSRFITIVSDDGAHSAVETILPSFASSRYSVRPTHQELADWESQRRQRIRRDRRDEFPRSRLDSNSANRFRILEDTQSFPIERPSISMSPDTTWAVEVQIEQDETDGVGSRTNVTLLPKERGSDMAPFIFRAISRVDRHHLFVVRRDSRSGPFDAAAAPEIQVRQISSASLFPTIISGRLIGFDADDLRHGRLPSTTVQNIFSTSEPGKHLRGIISLFGNLDSSRSFTDRVLWERVLQFLAGARISQDELLESQVHNLLFKRLKSSMKRPEAEKLAASAAKGTVRLVQARTVERFLSLARMQQWREEIAAAAGTGPTKIEYGSDNHQVHHAGATALTAGELTEDLAYLIDRDILHLGVNLQCPSCSGQQWYQAKSLGQRVECAGCGNSHSLPPSPEWSYKLNSLVRRAVPSGTMFVLQALREMADRATFSFYYSPSLEVHNGTTLLGELDIICLVNGELVLGEAKSGRPNKAEFEQFQTRVLDLRPDRAMIFVSQEHLADARPLFDEIRVEVEKQTISIELFSLPLY